MKNITLAALACALATAVAAPAAAQTPSAAAHPATLSITGTGSITRAPDRAVVRFSIVTDNDVSTRATSANNAAYNTLLTRLAALGLRGPAAVKTTGFNLSYTPRPPAPNPQQAQRYGYIASRSVAVSDERTDRVGAIIDAGVATGVTEIEGVEFGLGDGRAAYRAAQAAAFADADAQAHALAAAAHQRLVRIVALGDGSANTGPRPMFAPQAFGRAKEAVIPTDVQPSDLTVDATVSVVYEIAP